MFSEHSYAQKKRPFYPVMQCNVCHMIALSDMCFMVDIFACMYVCVCLCERERERERESEKEEEL